LYDAKLYIPRVDEEYAQFVAVVPLTPALGQHDVAEYVPFAIVPAVYGVRSAANGDGVVEFVKSVAAPLVRRAQELPSAEQFCFVAMR
jgi:hypothetical protein